MKERYTEPEMNVVLLETEDVITTSDPETELPTQPLADW